VNDLARIHIDRTPLGVVARISGEIDISNVAAVKRKLTEAVTSAARGLVVDISGTTYLDSSGVYLLFDLQRALEGRQQQLCVVAPPTTPSTRVLLITGFDRIVPVTSTVETALEKVGARAPKAPA
jgi:anti-sigma B factor antagonist